MANRGWNMWLQKSFLCIEVKKSLSFLFDLSKHVPYNFMGPIISLVSYWIEPFSLFYKFFAFGRVRTGMLGCQFSSVGEQVTIFHMARVQRSRFESNLQLLAASCPPLFLPTFLYILTAQISSKGIKIPFTFIKITWGNVSGRGSDALPASFNLYFSYTGSSDDV